MDDWRPAYHRLLNRIHRRYRTLTEAVLVAGRAYCFTRIADPNHVLDEVASEEDRIEKVSGRRKDGNHLHLPYWAELWDSALGMGELLVKRFENGFFDEAVVAGAGTILSARADRTNVRILDLGCGMGFTGMIAASLGLEVTFADLEPPALLFARLNSLPFDPPARTRQLNWQETRLTERFDLILGADILYERAQWEHLEPFWRHHLSAEGSILLGEPGRKTSDDFPAWIRQRGWDLIIHEQLVARDRHIRLFELMRDAEPPDTAGKPAG